MSNKRNNRGFTMMEMLIAVGLLVILMGLAFVAVVNYQRSMKQLELDRTAQEIYVAAQNHLTQAEAEGVLKQRVTPEAIGESHERDGVEYHYFYVKPNDSRLTSDSSTVLYDMLPAFSLDDTVRLGGSYVIEYDLSSATVINVFYSDQSNLSTYTFTSADYGNLFVDPNLTGSGAAQSRLDGTYTNKQIIGWFGGDDAKGLTKTRLSAPKIEIINGERLVVKVSFTTGAISQMTSHVSPLLQVFIEGNTSHSKRLVASESLNNFVVNQSQLEIKDGVGYRTKTYVLDDVTQEGKHFNKLWCESGDQKLLLGEDVVAQAKVSTTSMLANIAYSPVTAPENSLFQKLERDEDGMTPVAGVKNFRHLENLDPTISGFTKEKQLLLGYQDTIKAVQRENLTWADFKTKTNGENTQIHPLTGTASTAGTYLPVSNENLVSYDGGSLYVDGVKVNVAGSAGLFGTLTDCAISNLELRNFTVNSSGDTAGALAGTLNGASSVTNVIAKETNGATSRISGVGAGGLVGTLNNTSVVNASAASVFVAASGPNDTAAGGLVGLAGTGTAIRNSYAGGHTKDGFYDPDNMNVTATADSGTRAAGGLVGASQNATIENCYATTSVSSTGTAGGLVGLASGTITNCYATGLVTGAEGNYGVFIGNADNVGNAGNVTSTNNTYYSIVNPEVPAVGKGSVENITAFDENADTYKAYIAGHESPAATPYDSTLSSRYNNVYPLKTIKEMDKTVKEEDSGENPDEGSGENSGEGSGENSDEDSNASKLPLKILSEHYGDWPSPETIVVNTAS